jgi:hypothetical protein
MKNRTDKKYIIKVYEAQWDKWHWESVRPFFDELKIELEREGSGHDPLFSYYVFGTAEGLSAALNYGPDIGVDGRLKIGYFAVHGRKDRIQALKDISRVKLKNILINTYNFDGLYFGTCDFLNRKTAELFLNDMSPLKWIAGFSCWTPFLEGTICDILFFRLLFSGRFRRPGVRNTRWDAIANPEDAARQLYEIYPLAAELKFSLFYRTPSGIKSTLEDLSEKST